MSATADHAADLPADRVVVGRIGRAHGLAGAVRVDVRTDEPDRRFAVGQEVLVEGDRSLTIVTARWQGGRLVLGFAEVGDRDAAEALRGLLMEVDVPAGEQPSGDDEYFDRSLVGLAVVARDDRRPIGRVTAVLHLPSHDVLTVEDATGRELLVPFVSQIVTTVDLATGIVEVDLPAGLQEPNE